VIGDEQQEIEVVTDLQRSAGEFRDDVAGP